MTDFKTLNNYPANYIYDQKLDSFEKIFNSHSIPFLPIIGFENESWEEMYKEAKALSKQYVHHRASESQGWESLCIHGLSSIHTDHHTRYGYFQRENAPYKWTDVADYCPKITQFFQNKFDYVMYDRIRIMKLCAGGYIAPHRDVENYEESRIGPINIALNNPAGCKFYVDGIGYLPFKSGAVIKLNLFYKHAVYNDSNEDRYHLIVHGRMSSSWKQKILDSYRLQC